MILIIWQNSLNTEQVQGSVKLNYTSQSNRLATNEASTVSREAHGYCHSHNLHVTQLLVIKLV